MTPGPCLLEKGPPVIKQLINLIHILQKVCKQSLTSESKSNVSMDIPRG